jgi:hypothetical protein
VVWAGGLDRVSAQKRGCLKGYNIIEFGCGVGLWTFIFFGFVLCSRSVRQLYRNLLWSACLDYTMTYA